MEIEWRPNGNYIETKWNQMEPNGGQLETKWKPCRNHVETNS